MASCLRAVINKEINLSENIHLHFKMDELVFYNCAAQITCRQMVTPEELKNCSFIQTNSHNMKTHIIPLSIRYIAFSYVNISDAVLRWSFHLLFVSIEQKHLIPGEAVT